MFQDYDVLYLVTDVAPFVGNREWVDQFGEILILQQPEDMDAASAGRSVGVFDAVQ